ncbi:MAG: hypothetical protein AVDCRST_MAG35-2486 [uncultured Quadrisphaera sp.]|uniref:NAD(P)-binding domain-containing protein n=1 Tax=uncultured Quadrisphaera sp. TaxID=904978 RepID=A0A6J4Q3I1_9ACTN|nr:MAG: hypothetical protein AVDCRST_MAG35-2486 [uncultured Quadrisphaera sp.]
MSPSAVRALTGVMSDHTVLVLGSTGKTGRRVSPRLRLRGLSVRAASRSGATRFDWADPRGWDEALHGVSAVYVVPPAVPAAPGPVHEFVARAEAAGVQRLVLLSGHGADRWGESDFGRDMLSAEDAVRASALEWTVLRSANFDQNFDEELFHAPLVAGELALPAGRAPEPFIDVEDVADVAATVLSEPGRHGGEVYELVGPRAMTFAEAVDVIARASGIPMTYRQTTAPEYAAALVEQGVDADAARDVAAMYEVLERVQDSLAREGLSETTEDVVTVLGREPRTFEDYAARAAAAGAWDR